MVSFVLLVLTCATVTFASFISGLTGFGNGIIFQMCWSVMESWGVEGAGELRAGVAISYLMNPVNIAYLAPPVLRQGAVRWELVLAFAPGTVLFGFVGTAALSTLNQGGLKKGLGLLFFVFALWQLSVKLLAIRKSKRDIQTQFLQSVTEAKRSSSKQGTLKAAAATQPQKQLAITNGAAAAAGASPSSSVAALADLPTMQLLDSPHAFPSVDHRDDEDGDSQLSSSALSAASASHQPYVQLVQIESGAAGPLGSPLSSPSGFAPSTALVAASPPSSSSASAPLSPVTLPASRPRPPSAPPRPLRCGSFWSWLWSWSHQPVFVGAVGAGMASGFLQGLFGTGGPPIIFFFSLVDISKADIRGTSVWSNMVQLLPRFIAMLYFHIFDFPKLWPLYLCTIPATFLGTFAGNAVFKYVDVNAVLMVLQGLVLVSTISLTGATDGSAFGTLMLCVYMALVIAFSAAALYLSSMHWRFLRERPHSEVSLWVEATARRKEKERDDKRKAAEAAEAAAAAGGARTVSGDPMSAEDSYRLRSPSEALSYSEWHA